ncbi:Zeaxanthin epoxidase, chloroplastic, partial [Ananas comosus]
MALFYAPLTSPPNSSFKSHFPIQLPNHTTHEEFPAAPSFLNKHFCTTLISAKLRPRPAAATVCSRGPDTTPTEGVSASVAKKQKPRILIAGGGIGGLVLALAAKRKGFEVAVFEKDMSAVRGEGQYRGPIQIQSNALAALEAIDMDVAEELMRAGCITGDRINGLVDASNTHFLLSISSNPQNKHLWGAICGKWRKPSRLLVSSRSAVNSPRKARILVAGGGIGGLVFALAAKRKGFEVVVLEKDISAIRGEGQYRGPIQLQSNALAALETIDAAVAEEVMESGCVTGDRVNGIVDGVTSAWYIKFDTFTPAAERGLPVTRVISRMTLQQILARAVGDDVIMNESNVVDFVDDGNKVTVILGNGQRYEGDLLVGADGIWSKVRTILFGPKEASYSGYTCYTGIADFVPPDIETVGYRVFLGHKQYFVSSDVGAGKMQWYAFHKEPPGGTDAENGKKERLLKIFGGWCDNVVDLINATDEEVILRRDIYDRVPIMRWGKGRVTLLGDSVHAMQPNMGQGGCMAIEDAYQLALELEKAWNQSVETGTPMDIESPLKRYEKERRIRVALIYGMARMAAIMASTYRPYLGVGFGPLSFLTKLRIPHPGRVGGRFFIKFAMPLMLSWVLGGN